MNKDVRTCWRLIVKTLVDYGLYDFLEDEVATIAVALQSGEDSDRQLQIDTAEEVLKWKGKYHLLSRKINVISRDLIEDKIKELKKDMVKNGAIIDVLYEILEGELE